MKFQVATARASTPYPKVSVPRFNLEYWQTGRAHSGFWDRWGSWPA